MSINIESKLLLDRKIEEATKGLTPQYIVRLKYKVSENNALAILAPGQRGQKWNAAQNTWEEVIGDGKKAEGTGSWTESQIKKQSKADVEELFRKYEHCNIALIQGKVSECGFVIDIDGEQTDEIFQEAVDTLPEWLANKIYNSLIIKTGGSWGLHLYLRYHLKDFPDGLNLSTNRKVHKNGERNEIAVKADGAYVIAPDSMSSSGRQYQELRGDWDNRQLVSKAEIELFFSTITRISEKYKKTLVNRNEENGTFEKQQSKEQEQQQQDTKQIKYNLRGYIAVHKYLV